MNTTIYIGYLVKYDEKKRRYYLLLLAKSRACLFGFPQLLLFLYNNIPCIMNKLSLVLVAIFVLSGCSKIQPVVEVSFNYVLPESGSMTKATAAEVYDTFYENYIKTGDLLPNPYTLTITTKDGVEVAHISGEWKKNKPVMLSTGKYHVTGSSKGNVTYNDYYHRAPLVFDEDIEINENTSSITLHAIYDCFLLLFDAEGKTYFKWSADGTTADGISGDVNKAGDWYYIFAQGFKASGGVQWNYGSQVNSISMANFNFQKGYYYYYNDLSGSFEIPKMQAGSI